MKPDSVFTEIVGMSCESKVLEYFCEWDEMELTLSDIVKGCSLGRSQAYRVTNSFMKKGIIVSKSKGGATYYIFNTRNVMSCKIKELFDAGIKNEL
jgi:predicted transcriptional regulator